MKKEQFDRAKASPDPGVLIHLICNSADGAFYSDEPDALAPEQRVVLCVETFFSALCDGGFAAWFDLDHGPLSCCGPAALRAVGLEEYADLAERALQLHHEAPVPTAPAQWGTHLERIRLQHEETDCTEMYEELDTEFFALFQEEPSRFRRYLHEYIVAHEAEFLAAL